MINQLTVVAVILARGGSKGLPRKNVLPLAGTPLIAWTIEAARQSQFIDRIIVSTDDEEIAAVSQAAGAEVPFMRPPELARDDTSSMESLLHVVSNVDEAQLIVLLQPTSPLRDATHIDEALQQFVAQQAQLLVSVAPSTKPPHWQYELTPNYRFVIRDEAEVVQRQAAPCYYSLNGAIYIATVNKLLEEQRFLTNDTVAYLMDKESSYDIDDELDFYLCEQLMLRKSLKK